MVNETVKVDLLKVPGRFKGRSKTSVKGSPHRSHFVYHWQGMVLNPSMKFDIPFPKLF